MLLTVQLEEFQRKKAAAAAAKAAGTAVHTAQRSPAKPAPAAGVTVGPPRLQQPQSPTQQLRSATTAAQLFPPQLAAPVSAPARHATRPEAATLASAVVSAVPAADGTENSAQHNAAQTSSKTASSPAKPQLLARVPPADQPPLANAGAVLGGLRPNSGGSGSHNNPLFAEQRTPEKQTRPAAPVSSSSTNELRELQRLYGEQVQQQTNQSRLIAPIIVIQRLLSA